MVIRPLLITGLLLLMSSCQNDILDVDISDVKTEPLQIQRLDDDLFSITPQNIENKTREMKQKYGEYYEHYLMGFLCRNGTADTAYKNSVLSFVSDRDVRTCYRYVKKVYSDTELETLLPELDKCVKRFKFHFPGRKLPVHW